MLSEYSLEDCSTLLEQLHWNPFHQIVAACWMVHWASRHISSDLNLYTRTYGVINCWMSAGEMLLMAQYVNNGTL